MTVIVGLFSLEKRRLKTEKRRRSSEKNCEQSIVTKNCIQITLTKKLRGSGNKNKKSDKKNRKASVLTRNIKKLRHSYFSLS